MPKKLPAGFLLFNAARDGDVEGARAALGKRAPTAYIDNVSGMAPIHMACCNGHTAIVELLLDPDRGRASPVLPTAGGSTPMGLACLNRHADIVSLLLRAGASADAAGETGLSPLAIACANGDERTAKVLIDGGATATSPLAAPPAGAPAVAPPLLSSCMHGHTEVARLLMLHGAGIDSVRNERGTLLFLPAVSAALMTES